MTETLAVVIGATAGLSAILGALLLFRSRSHHANHTPPSLQPELLIHDGMVIDAAPNFSTLLDDQHLAGLTWNELRNSLSARFKNVPDSLPENPMDLVSLEDDLLRLSIQPEGGAYRLTLRGAAVLNAPPAPRNLTSPSSDAVMDVAPIPIWMVDQRGAVVWSNSAYKEISRSAVTPENAMTPFELPEGTFSDAGTVRASVTFADGAKQWFEVTRRVAVGGIGCFATSIDSLVEAEMAQRNFVQTLTKTFAHLPLGLAVFDRDRRLVLFNPALVDLTRLPVDFLSARPNLLSFFDHMRESRMMPEPKNYSTWREKLADVISAASNDRYCETWNLPTGLTYKITGRPHPDGAIAFLIEDISAEISLTRRFRSELELSQSVIDCFEDAVAVFSQLGVLTFCNATYRDLWKCDPDSAFAEMTIADATKIWQTACRPSPIWAELRDFVLTLRERAPWTAELSLRDGTTLRCAIYPVSAGATMVRFTPESKDAALLATAEIDA